MNGALAHALRISRFLSMIPWCVSTAWKVSALAVIGRRAGRRMLEKRTAAMLAANVPRISG